MMAPTHVWQGHPTPRRRRPRWAWVARLFLALGSSALAAGCQHQQAAGPVQASACLPECRANCLVSVTVDQAIDFEAAQKRGENSPPVDVAVPLL